MSTFCLLNAKISFADGPALVSAARRGDLEEVRNQLNAQVDVNYADSLGTTALMWAAKSGVAITANMVHIQSWMSEKVLDYLCVTILSCPQKSGSAIPVSMIHIHPRT